MGRQRKSNKHLPERVYFKTGHYYYVDLNNKWHNLGDQLSKAMIKWASLVEGAFNGNTMNSLFDRYMTEVSPTKAPQTFRDNIAEMKNLRAVFGEMAPEDVTPKDVYAYLDIRGKKARTRANREKALLSHVFTMAIRWGVVSDNPCRNVRKLTENKRDRYVTDEEFKVVRDHAPEMIQHAMDFAYLTGLRKGDILKIKLADLKEEGILIEVSKTGKRQLILWSDALKDCVNKIRKSKNTLRGLHLFSNRRGQPYCVSGFDSIWQRLLRQLHKEEIIKERFRFHDIRRKSATDAEQFAGREFARQLLGHEQQKTTAIYISGISKIKPLK